MSHRDRWYFLDAELLLSSITMIHDSIFAKIRWQHFVTSCTVMSWLVHGCCITQWHIFIHRIKISFLKVPNLTRASLHTQHAPLAAQNQFFCPYKKIYSLCSQFGAYLPGALHRQHDGSTTPELIGQKRNIGHSCWNMFYVKLDVLSEPPSAKILSSGDWFKID